MDTALLPTPSWSRSVNEPDRVADAIRQPPMLQRFVNTIPPWVVAASQRVITHYRGDAGRIWGDRPTADELTRRLEAFQGTTAWTASSARERRQSRAIGGVGAKAILGSPVGIADPASLRVLDKNALNEVPTIDEEEPIARRCGLAERCLRVDLEVCQQQPARRGPSD